MNNFILFIIILNIFVVIYNLYMWFTVQQENKALEKRNKELKYLLNKLYGRNVRSDKNV